MKTVVKLMVVLVTSRPPITRGSTLSSARASKTNGSVDDRTTRRTARDGTGREAPGDPPPPPPPPGRKEGREKQKIPTSSISRSRPPPLRSLRPRTSPACFVPSEDTSVRTRAAGIGSPARSRLPQARAAFTPDEKSHPRLPKKRRHRARKVSRGRVEKTGAGSNARESARLAGV